MSDTSPEVLSILRQLVVHSERMTGELGQVNGELGRVSANVARLSADVGLLAEGQQKIELRLGKVESRLDVLEMHTSALPAGLEQTNTELSKVGVEMMDRLDRFQATLNDVRDSTNVTIMMDQRVNRKLSETGRDRDELFTQMMAMERQITTLALRIDGIEGSSHP